MSYLSEILMVVGAGFIAWFVLVSLLHSANRLPDQRATPYRERGVPARA